MCVYGCVCSCTCVACGYVAACSCIASPIAAPQRQLFKDTLRNEQMVQEVQTLAKGVVLALLADKETLANFVDIVKLALRDPSTQAQVAELAKWLLAQPVTKDSLVALLNSVLEDPGFRQNVRVWRRWCWCY